MPAKRLAVQCVRNELPNIVAMATRRTPPTHLTEYAFRRGLVRVVRDAHHLENERLDASLDRVWLPRLGEVIDP